MNASRPPSSRALILVVGSAWLLTALGTPLQAQAAADSAAKPRVLLMATGGTIAGVQNAPGTLGAYRAGTLTAEQIVASVPELARFAEVQVEQFSNVASPLITPEQWMGLSRRIDAAFAADPSLKGVVVTHGTDRLEETGFFLYLTVRSERPVVMVGAQRPATGISPDGPINLLAAVRTAVSEDAVGKGVLVVMDDRIISAREVRKHYQRVGGFAPGDMGTLGVVASDGPTFFFAPTRRHGARSEFDLRRIDSLPEVALTFSYPGGNGPSFATQPAGVVVATTGFTRAESRAYRQLRRDGVVVVAAFPSGDNVSGTGQPPEGAERRLPAPVTAEDSARVEELRSPPMVNAQHLTPQKARILLMLVLTQTRDPREVQRYFREY